MRVGWFESPFNTSGPNGERSGYAYEYQQDIAAYTGWTYEYVAGDWSELLGMLEAGEIDLLADVSMRPGREESMLFSAKAMGAEQYCVYTLPACSGLSDSDPHSLNGTRIGVMADMIFPMNRSLYHGAAIPR